MRRWLLLLAVALGLAAPSAAQLREERHPELGLVVTLPADYTAQPIPPREQILRLSWRGPTGGQTAGLSVAILEGAGASLSTADYLRDVLRPESFETLRGGAKRYGMSPVRFDFQRKDEDGRLWRGILVGWEGADRSVLVIGQGHPASFVTESRRWRRVADTLQMRAARRDERGRNEWERHYAKGRYLGEERRIEERMQLPAKWSARDTIHYLVLGNVEDELMLRRISADLEILRATLARDLPPAADYGHDAASVVRVCADREEYLAYGGLRGALGYFSPTEAELVLYLGPSLEATLETVYHEAFHQYVYHSTGGVAPQPWFDEGMGEYYAGARIEGGRIVGIEPLELRLAGLRQSLAAGQWRPLGELLKLDQASYYANAGLHYAQGWSLVYFLRTDPAALGRTSWRRLLDRYYGALAASWSVEIERARPSGRLEVAPARARALAAAGQAALEGVDLEALEEAWLNWLRRD